ncbi:MAG: acyl-[acyl-carrier-protein]--UDP-N-acetylglucosamine O-acyltransferase, partial [Ignavibacteria bacterium]|nr:acyl-[acyl-carrier-protein]--UDP-N-acetylglucosamine O-acyltransferase [Ignavibacteria bacterium]
FAQIHQFCKIGKYVMFGGGRKATMDVPPFTMAMGEPVRYAGLNLVGLKRRGFTSQQINKIKSVYHILYSSNLNFSQAKERIKSEFIDEPLAQDILDFLNKSTRGILR